MWPNRVDRCGLGGVKGHIKAFEKVKQGVAPCKIDAGGNTVIVKRFPCRTKRIITRCETLDSTFARFYVNLRLSRYIT